MATVPSSFSENSSVTEHGFFGVDQDTYTLTRDDEFLIKISGIGDMPEGIDHERANITITNPDLTEDGHNVFSGSDGYFELLLPMSYNSQVGVYKVFVSFHGHILGEIYFTVERESINNEVSSNSSNEETEHDFAFRTSAFEVETDSLSYEKGSIIHITGIVPTQQKLDLTLQIIGPINNIILINQITPNSDGTFEDSINTNGPLWKFEGEHTIRINHNEKDLYSTFSFTIPTNEIVVPPPIEPSIDAELITPPVVIPPPPPPVVQQPVQIPQVQEESDPTGAIVVLVVIILIILIIAKIKSRKKNGRYSKIVKTSPPSIPTKIDDIKVAIEKIESLIRRNKNKIAECNEELIYYRGPQGGDWVTKDGMIGYYKIRIVELELQNDVLAKIRGFCEEESEKFAIEYLDMEISINQDNISENYSSVRSYESQNLDSITTPIVIEFLEKTRAEFQIEMNSCIEIKQIVENFKNSKKTKKQPLIPKFYNEDTVEDIR
ncbi:MAG: hypothetical protein O3C48_08345 [Crenarchaeota archaeon]|nr:hypothetical protein [Thermoproteota archaeon]